MVYEKLTTYFTKSPNVTMKLFWCACFLIVFVPKPLQELLHSMNHLTFPFEPRSAWQTCLLEQIGIDPET